MDYIDVLKSAKFGSRTAEDEEDELEAYFVQTYQWQSLLSGDIDVVYGPKGSGKTALYSLLLKRQAELSKRNIHLIAAENPSGTIAFKETVLNDPPTTEHEFRMLWKIYALVLIAGQFRAILEKSENGRKVIAQLNAGKLIEEGSLERKLRVIKEYVRKWLNPTLTFGTTETGMSFQITPSEPTTQQEENGAMSVDTLLRYTNEGLTAADQEVWLLFDRLDVAFDESEQLEGNALRALFRVLRDMAGLSSIRMKIFMRTDIWDRIAEGGFREGSHIERETKISWSEATLLNLVVRRLLHNESLRNFYSANPDLVLQSEEEQKNLFYKVFPRKIENRSGQSETFNWMIARTKDGLGRNAPREMIHLLTELKAVQLERKTLGQDAPTDGNLFHRNCFKLAMVKVSETRYNTLLQEHPNYKQYLQLFKGQKADHSIETLAVLWSVGTPEAKDIADKLHNIGFLREVKERFEVVPMFRFALKIKQGAADGKPRNTKNSSTADLDEIDDSSV